MTLEWQIVALVGFLVGAGFHGLFTTIWLKQVGCQRCLRRWLNLPDVEVTPDGR